MNKKFDLFFYHCEECHRHVGDKTAQWCQDHPEKTEGKILCWDHQKDFVIKSLKQYENN
jgi:hypothetical protein